LHTFRHQAAGTLSWVVDEECLLVAIYASGGFLISDDPSMTLAGFYAPALGGQQTDNFYVSNNSGVIQLTDLAFELIPGGQVYSSVSATNVVQLMMVK
jgi:hypothetical protein